jgi:hypothetical protein
MRERLQREEPPKLRAKKFKRHREPPTRGYIRKRITPSPEPPPKVEVVAQREATAGTPSDPQAVDSTRCQTRACPYPQLRYGLCRRCLQAQALDRSYTGSSIQANDWIQGF